MIQHRLIQILLMPFSLLYGLGVSLRNIAYKYNLLKGVAFNLPVISVGNLTVGGAGKTPHIEYLIRLLKDYINIATLSRGYGRKTKGFLLVRPNHNSEEVGDEPLQFRRKFPDIMVSVSENRTFAVPQLLIEQPDLQAVLLDDAFQHRSIDPGLNILLTEYQHPYTKDFLLPSGRLREWSAAAERADIIIVSKCPRELSDADRQQMNEELAPRKYQQLFFSYYTYQKPYYLFNPIYRAPLNEELNILLISAIARTDYLVNYLEEEVNHVRVLQYEDHHYFTNYDISHLKRNFEEIEENNKIILTTEKDAMRLELHRDYLLEHKLPIFVLPVEVAFHQNDGTAFNHLVQQFLLNFKV
ncbi:MAG: tetraacyldisaccharide 4'-kinase [Bacteroidota bacterium]